MVYDFPIKNSGSMIKNRKKGFNANNYWMNDVAIMSSKRRNTFLTE